MSSSETELRHLTGVPIAPPPPPATTPPLRDPYAAESPDSGSGADDNVRDDHNPSQEFSSLPPVDGGKQAWLFLAACFALEVLVWGFPFAFGVFQNFYSTNPPFAGERNIAVIGTCAMGIMYLSGFLVIGLLRLYPRESRFAPIVGLFIMCLALALSSFSQTVTHLIVTQGIFYAVGGSIAYLPCILYMDQWFVRRKGFAYGVMWSGTGLGGVVIPLLLEYLLGTMGFRTTLRIWSGLLFALTAPLAFFIKPRIPPAAHGAPVPPTHARPFNNLRFMLSRPFLLHQLSNIMEALGFFLPGIYLPMYAQSTLGASAYTSALTILLVNVASVFGCVGMGSLVDRFSAPSCIMLASAGAALGTFLIWGFSSSLGVLYLFCVVYGLFAGAYTSAWPGIMKQVTDHEREKERGVDPSMVFGMLAAGRGIGNVISGPLSETLIKGLPWKGQAAHGYGSGYGTLIVFTGVTALMGGASFLWKRIGWL
ncbi:major facilitator superfamily transporter [Colletotrichum karsti]|uniref:Major facilitator superfamily transporter n=1 Tax=Colletotrichum karsti TaxID=1095194 RepID=A0A9P6I7A4_9PEZI|nr:major facilitator superfamily transporter [Colletotrichum karsti]KAF9877299.1 major facilitator superfamily transporter [Colletotrichum karsti]